MISTNFVDIVILVIFLSSMLVGFGRGFVGEVLSLLTLIAAFAIAIMFASPLAAYLTSSTAIQNIVSQSSTSMGVSTATPVSYVALGLCFGLLFALVVIVGSIIKTLFNVAFSTGILGIGNRLLGAIFGLIRGYLINLVLIFVVQLSPLSSQPWWQQSQYVPQFQPAVAWLGSIVSPTLANLKNTFGNTIQNVGTTIQGVTKIMR